MRTPICDRLDIEFPIFAFTHCRDVVAAVSNAGGLGVLGAVGFSPEQLAVELEWLDEHVVDDHPDEVEIESGEGSLGDQFEVCLGSELVAGDIDFLSTDHCEFCLAEKAAAAAGGFPKVPNGCGGVGERIVVSHTLAVVPGKMTPARWQEVTCSRPAELMGLQGRKGRLAPGHDADIVLFDPTEQYRWTPLGESDRAGSLWSGLPVTGRVRDVWLRGRQVVTGGRLTLDHPGGEFLPRKL